MFEMLGFENLLEDTSSVITGEGKFDCKSSFGKVAHILDFYERKRGVLVIAIVICMGKGLQIYINV
jgi:glycerate kinase